MKMNGKWTKDPRVKAKTVKLLEDNRKKKSRWPLAWYILDTTPKARFMRAKIDKLDFYKIKIFCSVKDTIKRMKRYDIEWGGDHHKTYI